MNNNLKEKIRIVPPVKNKIPAPDLSKGYTPSEYYVPKNIKNADRKAGTARKYRSKTSAKHKDYRVSLKLSD